MKAVIRVRAGVPRVRVCVRVRVRVGSVLESRVGSGLEGRIKGRGHAH